MLDIPKKVIVLATEIAIVDGVISLRVLEHSFSSHLKICKEIFASRWQRDSLRILGHCIVGTFKGYCTSCVVLYGSTTSGLSRGGGLR